MIQTVRGKRKRKDTEESVDGEGEAVAGGGPPVASSAAGPAGGAGHGAPGDPLDLYQLQMNTLRRYKKHFQVTTCTQCLGNSIRHNAA